VRLKVNQRIAARSPSERLLGLRPASQRVLTEHALPGADWRSRRAHLGADGDPNQEC
jgi:hypothetical protein